MRAFLERRFHLTARGTTIRAELRGGVVTFLTMSYIVFVQPGVLASAGMDSGVAEGARTGLASVVTGCLFLLALFCAPLVQMVGGGIEIAPHVFRYPVTAPVMIVVGWMMMRSLRDIEWEDPRESVPAFLVVLGMPLCYSIADGLALGFVAWPLLRLLTGRGREVPALVYALALLLGLVFALKAGG